ncbi:filamin A-interacting protein 1-like [Rhopalosiphum padi]|uniref:filamin A-interacting protein 1-like n=1 Tax=Rhopalosiphum padi TaxID=40932 RepID=UPI00298D7802|nr:filamin A-interacting protein 1-like [Rhopalosiphum padi]
MLRIKQLQNKLSEAQEQIDGLMGENRLLKIMERRQENALSKYEGTHAQLPQVIKSYSADIRTLQTRLKTMKNSYRELEDRNRLISTELLDVQKQHKHLLDLTKNKQLGEREKLSNQLEEAENIIKQQETKHQNLMNKLELLNKNHRNQINVEISKSKALQMELNRLKETNDQLLSKIEKLKYQSYGGRQSYAFGVNQRIAPKSRSTVISKSSLLVDVVGVVVDRNPSSGVHVKTVKPELVHGESEISDHTKDLQKNLMRQVHEDVINKPNMLVNDKMESPHLNSGIAELMKKKDLSDEFDESIVQQIEPNEADNPFSLSKTSGIKSTGEHQSVTNLKIKDEELINAGEDNLQKDDNSCSDDDDDDNDTSSASFVSNSDE